MLSNKIVVKNSLISTLGHMCSMLLGFIAQRCFLHYLGLEIQGINSVISDMLSFLSLAELGVGSAIVFRMYKPIVEHDTEMITSLMHMYRYFYRIIGIVVFAIGNILLMFLPVFTKDQTAGMAYIRFAYYIQLISTTSTYFFSYKRSLFFADQKHYVCKMIDIVMNILFTFIRIITLVLFHNYIVYLVLQLGQNLLSNGIVAFYCNKKYPYIRNKNIKKYQNVAEIFSDTKDILFGKIAAYVYSATDNLVISAFDGLISVGGLFNYKYVTNSVKNLITSMTEPIMASVGNYVQVRDIEDSYRMLRRYLFIRYMVANIVATGLFVCTGTFVGIFYGEQYLMSQSIPLLIVIELYIGIIYGPLNEFTSVLGYFSYEKYIHIAGAAINLITSIVLVQIIGIQGVMIGTCISQVFFWIAKSILLFTKYFQSKEKFFQIWKQYISYTVVVIIQAALINYLVQTTIGTLYTVPAFIFEVILCVFVPVIIVIIIFGRTEEYQYAFGMIKEIWKKIWKRKAHE